nr:ethanolamine kinase 1 isoform X1 [Ciona intestinalis]|eukprot:XP_002130004.1 ethanolamine kinase 1 isoform X1 [Ciona intestinalis]
MSRIQNPVLKVNTIVDTENATDGAFKILKLVRPEWDIENITLKVFSNGITNKMFGFHHLENKDDTVLVRINGNGTEIFLDRKAEVENFEILHEHNCAPILYCIFNNGLAYQFIKGVTLTTESVRQETVFRLVGKEMAKMHKIPLSAADRASEPQTFKLCRKFLKIVFGETENSDLKLKTMMYSEVEQLEELLNALHSPLVFTHNDLLLHNIIYNKDQEKVSFIDYEYAGVNYQAADIGNHFCEFAGVEEVDYSLYPDRDFQLKWLRNYLACFRDVALTDVPDNDVERLYKQANKFALASHLFWSIWALVQAKYSKIDFDYKGYSKLRMDEYKRRKQEFLSL